MTGSSLLDWCILSVSLFNTCLLVWLGLTVVLNAARRSWGVWLIGVGLLGGALFFVSHTALLGVGWEALSGIGDFWWEAGWIPLIAAPLSWYVSMLWYAGFWVANTGQSRRVHRLAFVLLSFSGGILVILILFANPIPTFSQLAQLDLASGLTVAGVPLLIWLYPPYILLCIGFSFRVIQKPMSGFSDLDQRARHRARPWLRMATLVLLVISLLVGGVMAWVVLIARDRSVNWKMILTIGWADLLIAALISLVILLVGQSIVAHEIFTGHTIPRYGLRRHWRRVIILSGGISIFLAGGFVYSLPPIYILLFAVVLVAGFYGLLNWRLILERGRYMESLRPMVSSQNLYDQLVSSSPSALDLSPAFRTLCQDVLDASKACLVPLGPMAPLMDTPLLYPADEHLPYLPPGFPEHWQNSSGNMEIAFPLEPESNAGILWGLPLWSDRGLTGALYLGEKNSGALYTREEFEVARAVCERLVDTQASVVLAYRLAELQRHRLAETQIADHRTRRILHDEILPQLHTAMLALPTETPTEIIDQFTQLHGEISNLLREMPPPTLPSFAQKGLWKALQTLVETEFSNAFDSVTWELDPLAKGHIVTLPSLAGEVLFHAAREAIRNAARYGRPDQGSFDLLLSAKWENNGLSLLILDNGSGQEVTAEQNLGGGHGLQLHSTMLAVVGGTLAVESRPGEFTRVILRLPEAAWGF